MRREFIGFCGVTAMLIISQVWTQAMHASNRANSARLISRPRAIR